jgi:DNA-binding PadR family transcriptional regulator
MLIERLKNKIQLGFHELVILKLIAQSPTFGVAIIDKMNRLGYRTGPSYIYPFLKKMTHDGILLGIDKVVHGKRRRYYEMTQKGRVLLDNCISEFKQMFTTFELLGKEF